MIRLLKNAISRCSAQITGSLSGSINKFYYNQAPITETGNYVVYYLISNTRNGQDSGNNYSDTICQFNCFSPNDSNGDAVDNIATTIKQIFTKENLSVSGSTVINVYYDRTFPSRLVDKCWQSTIFFKIHLLNNTK